MDCPECKNEMELIDETYCNYNSSRASKGQHTGDIYRCDHCEEDYIDSFLDGGLRKWDWEL
jgi:hypothetical protein